MTVFAHALRLADDSFTSSCNTYTPVGNAWSAAPALPYANAYFAMITVNARPYMFGGAFNVSSNAARDTVGPLDWPIESF